MKLLSLKDIQPTLSSLIKQSNNISIISHKGPDQDAYASIMAVYLFIKSQFPQKKVTLIAESAFLFDLPAVLAEIRPIFKENLITKDVNKHLEESDLIIFVDSPNYNQFTKAQQDFKKIITEKQTIVIDHHATPLEEFNFAYQNSQMTSTSEILYRTLKDHIKPEYLKDFSLSVLDGILGDTGNLQYIQPYAVDVLDIVKEIVKTFNISIQKITGYTDQISKEAFPVFKTLIENTQFHNLKWIEPFTTSYLPNKISTNMEGYTAYKNLMLRRFRGYDWGFVVRHGKASGLYQISFRSNNLNVRQFAELFGGGGHDLAAAGDIQLPSGKDAKDAVNEIIKEIKRFVTS